MYLKLHPPYLLLRYPFSFKHPPDCLRSLPPSQLISLDSVHHRSERWLHFSSVLLFIFFSHLNSVERSGASLLGHPCVIIFGAMALYHLWCSIIHWIIWNVLLPIYRQHSHIISNIVISEKPNHVSQTISPNDTKEIGESCCSFLIQVLARKGINVFQKMLRYSFTVNG